MRYILAFDTALMGCTAALYDAAADTAWTKSEPMTRGQSERLVPMVQEILAEAGQDFSALDLIVTTTGPGAFTGLRLGLSAARAWGLSLNRPVAGVTTLDVLAAMFYAGGETAPIRILIETKRNDFYTQLYGPAGPASPAEAIGFTEVQSRNDSADVLYIGDAAARYADMADVRSRVRPGFDLCDPAMIARRGLALYRARQVTGMPEPVYLRGADVTESKRTPRRIADD